MKDLVSDLVKEARKWVGTVEKGGDNRGPEVEEFQKLVGGWAIGKAWCASFACYCVRQVEAATGILSPLPRSASAMTLWTDSAPDMRLEKPEVGAIVVWRKKDSTSGHVGIVVEVLSDTEFLCVEGNTGPGPGIVREGDGVYEKKRTTRKWMGDLELIGFIRCWRESSSVVRATG